MHKIARWDGGAWHAVGDIVADIGGTITILDLYVQSENEIYVTTSCTGASRGILLIKWDGTTWNILHAGTFASGNTPLANSIIKDIDDTYVYCGTEEVDASSLASYGKVWRWNGSAYTQLGEIFDFDNQVLVGDVKRVKLDQDRNIWAGGQFQKVGSLYLDSPLALWNGSIWVPSALAVNTTDGFREIFIRQNGDIYVGVNAVLNDVSAAAITSVYNISTIDISPIISIAGTGKILRLENQTTGQKIYLNYTLQENEILTIDFRRGRGNEIVTSNYRGNVPNAILPNSDDFFLAAGKLGEPKENRIACLIIDEVEPVVQLRYTPAHWSIDAGAL
jgi:hypothetical protein